MIDSHTHILPGMDDGSRNSAMSIEMLRMEKAQGIQKVICTPHYSFDEPVDRFLERRQAMWQRLQLRIMELPPEEQKKLPALSLGAEVAWVPNMSTFPDLQKLCYAGTNIMLLELPFQPWGDELFRQLYNLINVEIIPVIAHVDRYFGMQSKAAIQELVAMSVPIQISADIFTHMFRNRQALKLIQQNQRSILISDCHDPINRKPNIEAAVRVIRRKLGDAVMERVWNYMGCFLAQER